MRKKEDKSQIANIWNEGSHYRQQRYLKKIREYDNQPYTNKSDNLVKINKVLKRYKSSFIQNKQTNKQSE